MSTTSTRSQDWDNCGQRTALYSIRECLPYYSKESGVRPQPFQTSAHSKWIGVCASGSVQPKERGDFGQSNLVFRMGEDQ